MNTERNHRNSASLLVDLRIGTKALLERNTLNMRLIRLIP